MVRPLLVLAALVLLVPAFSGCADERPPPTPVSAPGFVVLDEAGAPVPFALASVFVPGNGEPVLLTNADARGYVDLGNLPASADQVEVGAAALGRALVHPPWPAEVRLAESGPGHLLTFRPHVDLVCTEPSYTTTMNCGQFGEPVVEVAGDGAIWASATCCIGKAPPIWVSRDGGLTFPQLQNEDTGLVRDTFGIEGDFAIDDAGNVYFFDISAATVWFTSYEADGTHRWTVPWTALPLVDRPWVRAGVEDQVWIVYNTGSETNVYSSTDGGKSWGAVPDATFPCPLGAPGQGPARDDLYVAAACGDDLTVWTSHDGGATWDDGDKVPMPDVPYRKADGRGLEFMNPPVADEAGNVYLAYPHFVDAKNTQSAIFVSRRNADGDWGAPVQISQPGMTRLPWGAAGRDGHVGFFWYSSEGNYTKEDKAKWHLLAAASVDAGSDVPHYQWTFADGDVLATGALGRQLGDFIEADVTPDGRIVAVYGHVGGGEQDFMNRFVASEFGLDLGPDVFLNGPRATS